MNSNIEELYKKKYLKYKAKYLKLQKGGVYPNTNVGDIIKDKLILLRDYDSKKIQEKKNNFFKKRISSESWFKNSSESYFESMAIDYEGNIFVADSRMHMVHFIKKKECENKYEIHRSIGTRGSGENQLISPYGVALDGKGNVVIADTGNHRIQVFDYNGKHIRTFGSEGNGDGQFQSPCSVAVNKDDKVLVYDKNGRIVVFNLSNGNYERCMSEVKLGREGHIILDNEGNVVVSDIENKQVLVLNFETGALKKTFGTTISKDGKVKKKNFAPSCIAFDKDSTNIIIIELEIPGSINESYIKVYNYKTEEYIGYIPFRVREPPSPSFPNEKPLYSDLLENPHGIVIDKDGQIIVNDNTRFVKILELT
jgi:DNA-binding beta-propeller fold protein YncE